MYREKVSIGFVGCGDHATRALFPVIPTIPEIELTAVCDLKEELAKRNARNFGAKRWYTDVDKMLSEEELDGVIICGPPQMHCEIGRKCLDKGLPIFVEKPSAISSKEAVKLAEYARKKGLWGSVAYMKRYSVCYKMAKEIVKREEFGKINIVEARFSNGPYPKIWGIEENARAFLIGQVIHIFNLIRFFAQEVKEVYAKLRQVTSDKFGYAITLEFKNGAIGVLNLNALEKPDWCASEKFIITGEDAWLEIENMVHLRYHPKDAPVKGFEVGGRYQTIQWQPDWTELMSTKSEGAFGYRGEIENFALSLLGKEKPRADLFDGAKDLQIAEAVWKSAQEAKVVKVGGNHD